MRKSKMAKISESLGDSLSEFYDDTLMESVTSSLFAPVKYRKKRVPTYLTIKIPVIEKHDCYYDDELIESGLLITLKEIKLFKIGTHIEQHAYFAKSKKGSIIKFTKYAPLSVKERQPLE